MKTILNYGITYNDAQGGHDTQYFSKISVVREYLHLLDLRQDISSLSVYQWEGKQKPVKKDITNNINLFLYR